MKMTKRVFAFVTAFVLCLAPMMLMTLAASTVCPHYQDEEACVIHHTSYSHSEKVASASVCYYWVWNAYYDCSICQWHWEGHHKVPEPHHFAANGICPNCGYDSNNE